jgi:hypothetical protein
MNIAKEAGFENIFIQWYNKDWEISQEEQVNHAREIGLNIEFAHLGYTKINLIWKDEEIGESLIDYYKNNVKEYVPAINQDGTTLPFNIIKTPIPNNLGNKLILQGSIGYSRTFDREPKEEEKTLTLIQEFYYNGAGYDKSDKNNFPTYSLQEQILYAKYVGKSIDFNKRFTQHHKNEMLDDVDKVVLYSVNRADLDSFEAHKIAQLKPYANKAKPAIERNNISVIYRGVFCMDSMYQNMKLLFRNNKNITLSWASSGSWRVILKKGNSNPLQINVYPEKITHNGGNLPDWANTLLKEYLNITFPQGKDCIYIDMESLIKLKVDREFLQLANYIMENQISKRTYLRLQNSYPFPLIIDKDIENSKSFDINSEDVCEQQSPFYIKGDTKEESADSHPADLQTQVLLNFIKSNNISADVVKQIYYDL